MVSARVVAACAFVATLALVLAWPVLQAESGVVLRKQAASGRLRDARLLFAPDLLLDVETDIARGYVDGRRWRLVVGAGGRWWCYSFIMWPEWTRHGTVCSRVGDGGGGTIFLPASLSKGRDTAVLVAVFPGNLTKVHLRATEDAPITGQLIGSPAGIPTNSTFLVAFLPARTDIVDADGYGVESERADVTRLVDLVDDY